MSRYIPSQSLFMRGIEKRETHLKSFLTLGRGVFSQLELDGCGERLMQTEARLSEESEKSALLEKKFESCRAELEKSDFEVKSLESTLRGATRDRETVVAHKNSEILRLTGEVSKNFDFSQFESSSPKWSDRSMNFKIVRFNKEDLLCSWRQRGRSV